MTSIITLFFLSLIVSLVVAIILKVPIVQETVNKISTSINSKIEVTE